MSIISHYTHEDFGQRHVVVWEILMREVKKSERARDKARKELDALQYDTPAFVRTMHGQLYDIKKAQTDAARKVANDYWDNYIKPTL